MLDRAFIDSYTTGFDSFAAALRNVSWDLIVEQSGLCQEAIQQAARIYVESKRTIICWAMGLTQHKNAVANIQEVVNLLLLRGNLGKPGAGACPVRGHSNVQGDRTMGIWESPSKDFLDRLGRAIDFEPPRKPGFNTVEAIEAMHRGQAKVFIGLGGNFVMASPDTDFTKEALQRCQLTVHISTKLNRSHLVTGTQALILPCLARSEIDASGGSEQFVTVENSMSVVHPSRGRFPPAGEQLRSEPAIVAGIASALLGSETSLAWPALANDYDRIRDLIQAVVPGFENYNQRVRQEGGFVLPNGARERVFSTESARAHFTVHAIPPNPLANGQFLMMTIRSHDQYNTTIYSENDRYRGVHGGRRVVLMHSDDVDECGLRPGQPVDLTSHFEGQTRLAAGFVVVPYDIPRRCVGTYFPEANILVPVRHVADVSHTPASKSVVVSIRPASGQ